MIIAAVEVDWFFQAESVDSLQAFSLDFDLLGVWKVTQRHSTVVQCLTLLFGSELVEVRHGVGLGDFVFRQLVQIRLYKRAILTIDPFGALVCESGGNRRFLLAKGCVVRVELV